MHNQRISGWERLVLILERFIGVGLYLVLLSPLLVWSGFLFPHLTAKVLGFQILVELILAAFLIVILLKPREFSKTLDFLRLPIIAILAAFIVYSLLTAIFGVDLSRSLWGIIDRQDGLVLLAHFLSWTVVSVWYYGGASDPLPERGKPPAGKSRMFQSYLYFSFWVSVAVALTALGETEIRFNSILRSILATLASPVRISGVFGNPTFLGPYLLFHFFFGIHFLQVLLRPRSDSNHGAVSAAKSFWRRRAARVAQLSGILLGIVILAFTILTGQTRGVVVALVVGLIAISAMFVRSLFPKRYVRVAGIVLIVCIVLATVAFWKYRNSPIVSQFSILQRLGHFSPAQDASTAVRLLSWGSGLRSTLDHPILGWGYNNVYYALNKHYDPRQIKWTPFLEASNSYYFDKSHNFFLDLLIERGIIGVLLYLLLLGVIVRSLWRLADRRLAICMSGALISYLISNIVAFDTFGSFFGFFLFMSCVASVGNHEPIEWLRRRPDRKGNASKAARKKTSRVPRFPALRIVVVIIPLAVGMYLQAEIAYANYEYAAARSAFAQDLTKGVLWYVDGFSRFSPYAGREKLTGISLIVKTVITKGQSSQSFDASPFVFRWTEEALAAHPQDGASYIALNDMYNNLALHLNPEFAVSAEAFGKKALELLPTYQAARFNLGRTYMIRNEPARAVELNRRMLQDTDFPLGHWYLGLSLLQNDQRDEAKKEIRKAVEMGYQLSAANLVFLKGHMTDKDVSELTAGK